jgi:hypothetical protein
MNDWRKLPEAVACIDATSHEIILPSPELQRQYNSGHRHYHCVHTQVVINNNKKIVHVESGFRGHNNGANTFDMMTPIGDGRTLDFPRNYVLFLCVHTMVMAMAAIILSLKFG